MSDKENINTQKVNENPKEKSKKENNMIHHFFQIVYNKNLNNKNYSDKKVILKTDSVSNNTALKRKHLQNYKNYKEIKKKKVYLNLDKNIIQKETNCINENKVNKIRLIGSISFNYKSNKIFDDEDLKISKESYKNINNFSSFTLEGSKLLDNFVINDKNNKIKFENRYLNNSSSKKSYKINKIPEKNKSKEEQSSKKNNNMNISSYNDNKLEKKRINDINNKIVEDDLKPIEKNNNKINNINNINNNESGEIIINNYIRDNEDEKIVQKNIKIKNEQVSKQISQNKVDQNYNNKKNDQFKINRIIKNVNNKNNIKEINKDTRNNKVIYKKINKEPNLYTKFDILIKKIEASNDINLELTKKIAESNQTNSLFAKEIHESNQNNTKLIQKNQVLIKAFIANFFPEKKNSNEIKNNNINNNNDKK